MTRAAQAVLIPRDDLTWDTERTRATPWLAELADVPDDAAPPLWMSPPSEDAVCSYGWSGCTHVADGWTAVEWIERVERKRLRWWQRLAITRQLEHRADGSLCYRSVVESAPRRAGKSVRMRGVASWRLALGAAIFGEVQTIMHTGSDIPICREIQRGAWRWAEAEWGAKAVTKANGKESIETNDGDRWLVRSQEGVYGYDVTLALGDECWNVKPDTVSEGLEPATLERASAQVHLTSTAHRRATSLMRGKLSTALTTYSTTTLVIVWAAPAGSDPTDPAVWQMASPHWTEDRRQMIADKLEAAQAGQVDPQADDPDPMAGFTAQYLNIWRLVGRAEPVGTPLVAEEDWTERVALADDRAPDAVALEPWQAAGVSLALAWREETTAMVSVTSHASLADAVAALRLTGFRGRALVADTLTDDPALRQVARTPVKTRTTAAAADLSRLLAEGVFQHDGGAHLTDQVLDLRVAPATDGLRVTSRERADAVKAAVAAAGAARAKPKRALQLVMPSGS